MAKRRSPKVQSPLPRAKRQKASAGDNTSVAESSSSSSGSAGNVVSSKIASLPKNERSKRLRVRKQPRAEAADDDFKPAPTVKTIRKTVKSKIQQVLQFNTKHTPAKSSALEREGPNLSHAAVTELAVIAAVMRMCSDYEISDPTLVCLEDVRDILLHTFEKPIGDNPCVKHVVLDLSQRSAFEDSVHMKFEGHGLADIGLLEIEFEMLARDTEIAAANGLFRHMHAVYDESDGSAEGGLGDERALERSEIEDRTAAADDRKEVARVGVCPAPLFEA